MVRPMKYPAPVVNRVLELKMDGLTPKEIRKEIEEEFGLKLHRNNLWYWENHKETEVVQKEGIISVNANLIRELKWQGKFEEANNLIYAFRDNCKKMQGEDFKRISKEMRFKDKVKKIKNNQCFHCKDKMEIGRLCMYHHLKKMELYGKRKEGQTELTKFRGQKKKLGQCLECTEPRYKNHYSYCKAHKKLKDKEAHMLRMYGKPKEEPKVP